MGLSYTYGTTNNNGNVLTHSYAGGGLSYTQTFGYDELNRLTVSGEGGASWLQTNKYDRYGNRWIDLSGTPSLSFNTANRITNAGYAYDAAGNLFNDGMHSYGFDAENKIKTVNGETDVYRYDGDGNRVRKNFTYGEKLRMVYSGGQLIAEYDLSNGVLKKEYVYGAKGLIATIEPVAGTKYTTSDHLGTPRVVTNPSAGVISRHDYKPFGQELGAGDGGRTAVMGFSVSDGVRQKFTSKERDNETGLDYFGARYYSSTQGRFTSPDEFKGGPEELFGEVDPHDPLFYSDTAEPQSLNKYQYCLNNPLRYIDPDGHQTTTADALKLGAGLTVAAPHPVAKAAGVLILVGVAVEVTIGWDNVGKAAKGALDWAASGNTAGDASCPACGSSERMGQALMKGNEQANQTAEKTKNVADAEKKGIPKDQLGPSGKPKVNVVKHPTEKRAKDAARNQGQGQPAKDARPKKGGPHYHPTNRDGSRKKGKQNIHHEYPE